MAHEFHTLGIGQFFDFDPDAAEGALIAVRAYQKHWRKMGWGYAATTLANGCTRIARLPDRVGKPRPSIAVAMMPENYGARLAFNAEAELLRVFAKILNDGVENATRLPGMKAVMILNECVAESTLRNYCTRMAAIRSHPYGSNAAFTAAFESLLAKLIFVRIWHNGIKCIGKGNAYV